MERGDLDEKQKLFLDGLLKIEARHLDYFLQAGRIQESCQLIYVKAIRKGYLLFNDKITLPDYIKDECARLYERIFK